MPPCPTAPLPSSPSPAAAAAQPPIRARACLPAATAAEEEEEEEEETRNAQGDDTATTTTYDPHEYQPPHPDANTEKDTTDKDKKAITVKHWCGNCEKELDPKKLKSCSRCKVIKYCCRDCQTVSSECGSIL